MAFDYDHSRRTTDRLIRRFGRRAALRRNDTDRPVSAGVVEWKPHEKGLVLEGSQRAVVSALDPTTKEILAVPPDHEQDKLIFNGKIYRLVAPDRGPRPDGNAVFHDLEVIYDSSDV